MFSSLMKKVGELDSDFTNSLLLSPTSTSTTPSEPPNPQQSSNAADEKVSALEAELQQLRLQSKLKIAQLQKELSNKSGLEKELENARNAITELKQRSELAKSASKSELNDIDLRTANNAAERTDAGQKIPSESNSDEKLLVLQNRIRELEELSSTQQTQIEQHQNTVNVPNHRSASLQMDGTSPATEPDNSEFLELKFQLKELQLKYDEETDRLKKQIEESNDRASSIESAMSDAVQEAALEIEKWKRDAENWRSQFESLKGNEGAVKAELASMIDVEKRLNVTEERNFTLEEQIQDVKMQLVNKQKEITKLQDMLSAKTAEMENSQEEFTQKITKQKGIMAAASKNISEMKKQLAAKDTEIQEQFSSLEACHLEIADLKLQIEESKRNISHLETEIHMEKETRITAKGDFESELVQIKQENETLKEEFQQYKLRAHAALQKSAAGNLQEARITNLEQTKSNLESQLRERIDEIEQLQSRHQKVQSNLTAATDQIAVLESLVQKLETKITEIPSLRSQIDELNAKINSDQSAHTAALQQIETERSAQLESLRIELKKEYLQSEERLKLKDADYQSLHSILEGLNADMSSLREELSASQSEVMRLRSLLGNQNTNGGSSIPPSRKSSSLNPLVAFFTDSYNNQNESIPESRNSISSVASASSQNNITSTMSSPVTGSKPPLRINVSQTSPVTQSPGASTTYTSLKEKEMALKLQQFAELVQESEATIQRLLEQEKILKEEIRRVERQDKVQSSINVEYLKNVLISFLESSIQQKEGKQRERDLNALIPVLTQMLMLSPEEISSLKKSIQKACFENTPAFGMFGIV